MSKTNDVLDNVIIKFAGDSGDGMQLTGTQFTNTAALLGNDLSTFPDFPAEIRAPQGTLAGVSGYQLHFGSVEIFTPGDQCDVLVAMNAAALKANLSQLKKNGMLIANSDGFDPKNLRLAGIVDGKSPLEDGSLDGYHVITIDVTKMTRAALNDSGLGTKEIDRAKNMFVLGFLYWMYNRTLDHTIKFLEEKFSKKPDILSANIKVLKAGYHFGDTREDFTSRFTVGPARMEPGTYRNIMGNQATALGLLAASQKSGLDLFYGTYPITPASDILHELSKYKQYGVRTFQAEDEIAAICSAIGASFGGGLGVTASSGHCVEGRSHGPGAHAGTAPRHLQRAARRSLYRIADEDGTERPDAGALRAQWRISDSRSRRGDAVRLLQHGFRSLPPGRRIHDAGDVPFRWIHRQRR